MSTWNKKNFSIFTSDEKSALGLIEELGNQTNHNTEELEKVKESDNKKVSHTEMNEKYKLDENANFTGTWFGISRPTGTNEGLQATVEKIVDEVIPKVENSATKEELEVERNRISNLIGISSGEVDNVEVSDARNGLDGKVYNSLGDAIRTQFKTVNNDLENVIGDTIEYNLVWHDNYYVDNTNGKLVENTSWKYTDYVDIKSYEKIILDTSQEGSTSYNAFYDKDKNFISLLNIGTKIVSIPTNAKYFRLSNDKRFTTKVKKYLPKLIDKVSPSYVDNKVNEVNEKINVLFGDVNYKIDWINGGYINNVDGVLTSYDGWKYTDFISLNGATKIKIKTSQVGSTSYNAFYDENKTFISKIDVSLSEKDVPTNAVYFRLSCSENSTTVIVKDITNGTNDIISLNKDMESCIIQASEGLGQMFTNKTKPLVFTHFSDIHTMQELWNRIVDFNNHYLNYLDFSIHTGDYCGGSQLSYVDLYANGKQCNIPILNCVGNHDTYIDNGGTKGEKKKAHDLLFNHKSNWGVTFMNIDNSMTYYKDFSSKKIRLIVLDYYYDIDLQCIWLQDRLNEARNLGYHVITCMHEMTNVIINKVNTPFQTLDNFESLGGNKHSISKFDKIIGDWKKTGGVHVANFAGHEHSDFIGYTENDVLNICVQCATDNVIWTDSKREKNTKSWDCFNLVAIDVATNNLKLVRIGNNYDHYLREKKTFSYDYVNKEII